MSVRAPALVSRPLAGNAGEVPGRDKERLEGVWALGSLIGKRAQIGPAPTWNARPHGTGECPGRHLAGSVPSDCRRAPAAWGPKEGPKHSLTNAKARGQAGVRAGHRRARGTSP
jgi:hypothetical protein